MRKLRRVNPVMIAQPVAQRAAYLLRLYPKLADLTGLQKPIIELGDAA